MDVRIDYEVADARGHHVHYYRFGVVRVGIRVCNSMLPTCRHLCGPGDHGCAHDVVAVVAILATAVVADTDNG